MTANIRSANAQYKKNIFLDHFDGTSVSSLLWFYQWWVSQADGTYHGYTQFRTAQNASLPATENSEVSINLDTYNPTGPNSYYGTNQITTRSYKPGKGIIYSVRAKIKAPVQKGIVFGIYGYELTVPGMRGWSGIASDATGTNLTASVAGGDIWTYNSTAKWSYQNQPGPHVWNGVTSSEDGKFLAAIECPGYVWTSSNYGITWTKQLGSGPDNYNAISSDKTGKYLIIGGIRGYVKTSSDYGVTWKIHTEAGSRNWYDVDIDPDGLSFGAVDYGVHVWTSTGDINSNLVERIGFGTAEWKSIAVRGVKVAVTSQGNGVWISTDRGITCFDKTGNIDSPYLTSIIASKDGTKLVILGYAYGSVWTSTDFGASANWTKKTGLDLSQGNYITGSADCQILTVVVFAGNIWRSEDFGTTWTNQSGSDQTLHDEIDIEFLTNNVNKVYSNVYSNEPMGVGHPDSVVFTSSITDYHIYSIEWLPTGVTWKIDGNVFRTSSISPKGPMRFDLNAWASDIYWKAAYNGSLQWTNIASENKTYSMIVDYVRVDSLTDIPTAVADVKTSDEIGFYPNPANDQIYFTGSYEGMNVTVSNLSGQVMINSKIISNCISITDLPRGLYIVRFYKDKNYYSVKKLIIN